MQAEVYPLTVVISTHALREEGDNRSQSKSFLQVKISTPPPREEGDGLQSGLQNAKSQFLPTPSARRATSCKYSYIYVDDISTHALREEGDGRISGQHYFKTGDFYPRPPRGGRQEGQEYLKWAVVISTHALREEGDPGLRNRLHTAAISTHALREEGD